MWSVINYCGKVNVIPLDDTESHIEETTCKCGPRMEEGVIIHNSFDGREFAEQAKARMSKDTN